MVRINVILTEENIEKIDAISRLEKKSRSQLLRESAEMYITEYEREIAERLRKEKLAQAIEAQDEIRAKSKDWNGVSAVRKWRDRRK